MFADYHVHSSFSIDSSYPMGEVCARAVELELDEICFTDHVDYGVQPDVAEYELDPSIARLERGRPVLNVDYDRYFPAIERYRDEYSPHLTVRTGMEFGVQTHTIPCFDCLFDRYRAQLDFIIMSVHQIDDLEFWTGDYQAGKTQAQYNIGYYEELLAVATQFDHWSVLGHLDLIKRYDPAGIWPDDNIMDIVAEILRTAIAKGKGIELNTSCFRYGLPDLQPSTRILELYRDLGGRILTIGSDSHKPEHLAAHIPAVRDRLRAIGFDEFCTFEKMKPVFHRL